MTQGRQRHRTGTQRSARALTACCRAAPPGVQSCSAAELSSALKAASRLGIAVRMEEFFRITLLGFFKAYKSCKEKGPRSKKEILVLLWQEKDQR